MKLSLVLSVMLSFAVVSQAAPMHMDKRRFGQEHTPEADATFQEIKDLAQGSDKEAQAGNLSGAMVRALLAKAPACDQQDRADEIIDLGREFGGEKEEQFIKLAQTYRQLERNTPKDGQPSELCDKPPKNKELDGLTQAQDPTGNPKAKDPEEEDPEEEDPKGKAKDPEEEDPEEEDPKGKAKDPEEEDPEEEDPKGKDKDPEDPKGKDKDPEEPKGKDKDPEEEDPEEEDPEEEDPEEDPEDDGSTNPAETDPVGGVKMPKIKRVGGDRPFSVNGNTFVDVEAAQQRQCDIQNNLCFNKFNSGDRSFTTEDCANQTAACKDGPPVFE